MTDSFDLLNTMVPMVSTLGLQRVEVTEEHAVLRMPDRADLHNHVGGPHAGALFSLAESATGVLVIGSFADLLDRYVPLAAGATIRYVALAKGDVTAEATLGRSKADVLADLEAQGKARFDVTAVVRDIDGRPTTEVTVEWALKALRKPTS